MNLADQVMAEYRPKLLAAMNANGTPELSEETPGPAPRLVVRSVIEALAHPPPEPDVLVDGLMRRGEKLVIGAPRAVGKSWLAMGLAVMLARGEGLFLGKLPVRQRARVLYCHGELGEWDSWKRWQRLTGGGPPPDVLETFEQWRIRIVKLRRTTAEGTEEFYRAVLDGRVEETILRDKIDVLMLDPWRTYYAGAENSNDEAEAALATLDDLRLRHGTSFAIPHHFGKATEARDPEDLWRGATRLADWASTRVTLLPHYSAKQAADQGMTRHQARRFMDITFLRRNDEPTEDFSIKWEAETGYWQEWFPQGENAGWQAHYMAPADVAALCPVDTGWPSIRQAARAMDCSQEVAERRLKQAVWAGLLEEFNAPRNARGYRLAGESLATFRTDQEEASR